jgi:hypothetical protein
MTSTVDRPYGQEPSVPSANDGRIKFVDRAEFSRLLISRKRLIRLDSTSVGESGLLDLDTGVRYVLQQNEW